MMKNINILDIHWKFQLLGGGGSSQKIDKKGGFLKRGDLESFQI